VSYGRHDLYVSLPSVKVCPVVGEFNGGYSKTLVDRVQLFDGWPLRLLSCGSEPRYLINEHDMEYARSMREATYTIE
jgi:hypothetical protein